jgi:hypothetical protein
MGVYLNNQKLAKPFKSGTWLNALKNNHHIWVNVPPIPPVPDPVQMLPGTYGQTDSASGVDYYDTSVRRGSGIARGRMSYRITQAGYYSIELAGAGGGYTSGADLSTAVGNPGGLATGTDVYIATGYLAFVVGGSGGNATSSGANLSSSGGGGGSMILFPSGSQYWAWFAGGGGGGVSGVYSGRECGGGGGGYSGRAGTSQGTVGKAGSAGLTNGVGGDGGYYGTGTGGIGGSSYYPITEVMRPGSENVIAIPTYTSTMTSSVRIGGQGGSANTVWNFAGGWSKWTTSGTLSSYGAASSVVFPDPDLEPGVGAGGQGATGNTTATKAQTGWLTLTFLHT